MKRAFLWLAPVAMAAALSLLSLIPLPPPEPPTYPKPTASPLPSIVVLSVGDSLTYGTDGSTTASYRGELSKLLRLTGQPHQWVVSAAPGSKCSWWVTRLDALITTHHPAIIFLNCGTNDTPTDATEQDYRAILGVAAAHVVPVVASLIGIPDMRSPTNSVRPSIYSWMEGTNLAIRRALAGFPAVPVANLERIPATPEWLQADGIHWTARAEAAVGQIFYEAARALRGWLTFAQMHVTKMCGLSGVRPNEPWLVPDVDYRVCRT